MATARAANPPARLNRGLLTVIGLILLLAGAFLLSFGVGALRTLLPGVTPDAALLPESLALPTWVAYVAIAVAAVVGLLCLRWLLAQTRRRPSTRDWDLTAAAPADSDPTTGHTILTAGAAADAVAADIRAYPGVTKANATLSGLRVAPALQLDISIERDTSLAAVRDRISSHALPRLRQAMELDAVPTQLLLRLDAADSTVPRTR